jgi:hypothetical protein
MAFAEIRPGASNMFAWFPVPLDFFTFIPVCTVTFWDFIGFPSRGGLVEIDIDGELDAFTH